MEESEYIKLLEEWKVTGMELIKIQADTIKDLRELIELIKANNKQ
ncbi:MAG: hypothetical protein OEZ01_07490 [Candidatus Heimdallarchaeota archaeon]|nr:hypothetical protein [Candidatus Heimdallarchaeota archaeon]